MKDSDWRKVLSVISVGGASGTTALLHLCRILTGALTCVEEDRKPAAEIVYSYNEDSDVDVWFCKSRVELLFDQTRRLLIQAELKNAKFQRELMGIQRN